jgi:AraC family transcriptional regulator
VPVRSLVSETHDGVFVYRRGGYPRTEWLAAETYKFVFVGEGRYAIEFGDGELSVAPGQFLVVNPHTEHRHVGLSGAKLLVEIRIEAMAAAAAALGRTRPPRFRQLRASDGLIRAWVREWAADAEAGASVAAADVVAGLALRLIELQLGRPRFRAGAAVAKAVALIEERFAERLTLDELAAAAGMERFAFSHAFRQETGLAPCAYLRERRLAAAAAVLEARQQRIIDVAFGCGFGSVSSFNRAFRVAFGVTPSRYRVLASSAGCESHALDRAGVRRGIADAQPHSALAGAIDGA